MGATSPIGWPEISRASTSGSGLSLSHALPRETRKNTAEKNHGPVYLFQSNHASPAACAGRTKTGPSTAPNVEAKRMRLIAAPRSCGAAKSVAA